MRGAIPRCVPLLTCPPPPPLPPNARSDAGFPEAFHRLFRGDKQRARLLQHRSVRCHAMSIAPFAVNLIG
jgi:hypothetical protein